jgi:hypothetical protein
MGTGAVSRYKLDRSQKTVMVQDFYCGQMRVSGYKIQKDLSEEQGSAKTVTSLLTLPPVLGGRSNIYFLFTFL